MSMDLYLTNRAGWEYKQTHLNATATYQWNQLHSSSIDSYLSSFTSNPTSTPFNSSFSLLLCLSFPHARFFSPSSAQPPTHISPPPSMASLSVYSTIHFLMLKESTTRQKVDENSGMFNSIQIADREQQNKRERKDNQNKDICFGNECRFQEEDRPRSSFPE